MNLDIIKSFVIVGVLLCVFDLIWLKYFFLKPISEMVKNIQFKIIKPNMEYALPAYILLILSIIIYVLPNIKSDNILLDSIKYGGLLGLIIYGIFDLTNLVMFEKYSFNVAIIDMIWGSILFTLVSYFSKHILLSIKYII